MIAGNCLERGDADVLRSAQANRVREFVDVSRHVGDERRGVLHAVSEHQQRLNVKPRHGIESLPSGLDAGSDRGGTAGIELIAGYDVLDGCTPRVEGIGSRPQRSDADEQIGGLIETHDRAPIALQHHIDEN